MIELSKIQKELKAPKNQYNNFGKYNYRSCEDILEGVKPLLGDCVLTISDSLEYIGGRIYIKATAKISKDDKYVEVSAYAREPEIQKGMNESQITGSASSYARKYALNGLFCIDDTKDADSQDNRSEKKQTTKKVKKTEHVVKKKPTDEDALIKMIKVISSFKTKEQLESYRTEKYETQLKYFGDKDRKDLSDKLCQYVSEMNIKFKEEGK